MKHVFCACRARLLAVLLTLMCAGHAPSHAQGVPADLPAPPAGTGAVYQGSVGAVDVVMHLGAVDLTAGATGRYAYLGRGIDLPLRVQRQGDRLTLTEYVPTAGADDLRENATFEGREAGGTIVGVWRARDGGRVLPFRLARVNPDALQINLPPSAWLRELRRTDPYSYLKINRPLKRTGTRTLNGQRYQLWMEPLTRVTYPRLDEPPGTPVNLWLQDLHLRDALAALDCLALAPPGRGAWAQETHLVRLTPRTVSLETTYDTNCGGAYPNRAVRAGTYDRQVARELTVEDTFDFGPRLTGLLTEWLRQYTPRDSLCRTAVRTSADPAELAVSFTAQGLRVRPNLPHVLDTCQRDITIIPYANVRSYALPHGPLYRELFP